MFIPSRLFCTLTNVVVLGLIHTCPMDAAADSPGEGKPLVVLVGDSTIASGSGWGDFFCACTRDSIECKNLARRGRSSSTYRDEGLWDAALQLKPDWILIQFGHNDQPGHAGPVNEADGSFRDNIERYVDEARTAGAKPVLLTPLSRRRWSEESDAPANDRADLIASTLEPYARVVREIAAEKQVPVVDLHAKAVEVYQSLGRKGCEQIAPLPQDGRPDLTHLNDEGGLLFGTLVAMECRSHIRAMASYFPTSKLAELQNSHRKPLPVRPLETPPQPAVMPATPQGQRTLRVASDGSADFRTIQAAIASAPSNNSDRTLVKIAPGIYTGQIVVPPDKSNLIFEGDDRDATIITYALTVHDPVPPGVSNELKGHGVVVLADGFEARGITFRQVAGDHGQAIALRIDGDNALVEDCNLIGWQDTLRLEGDGHHFRECHIEGRVDYIYGGASAVFERCRLHTKNDGYVTAASTPQDKPWGFVFVDCKLTGTGRQITFLGRPWRPYASVTFIDCSMDDSIRPAGWNNWRNADNEQTARYSEFGTKGPGANPARRVKWSRQLTAEEAARFAPAELLKTTQ